MHQTRKGQPWYFGMKAHIGADADSGLVHSLHTTAANESDIAHAHEVLHGEEWMVFMDAGYIGIEKRTEILQAQQDEKIRTDVEWLVAQRRSRIDKLPEGPCKEHIKGFERAKAQIRAFFEYPFHVVKNLFHDRKTRYKGLAKNTARLYSLFALANLAMAKKRMLDQTILGTGAS